VKKIVTHILTNFSKGNLRESHLLHEYANGKRNIYQGILGKFD
jgi:hypothetical protein